MHGDCSLVFVSSAKWHIVWLITVHDLSNDTLELCSMATTASKGISSVVAVVAWA